MQQGFTIQQILEGKEKRIIKKFKMDKAIYPNKKIGEDDGKRIRNKRD